jgi:hypothetical protein
MLNMEAQQRAREALRRIDQAAAADAAAVEQVQKQGNSFRENMFGAFQFLEGESMTLQELQIQFKRIDKQQFQVQPRGRPTFLLVFNPEVAYDSRPHSQSGEGSAQSSSELATRLFAVLAPPNQGLLRYYTVFSDGVWKRTTFAPGAEGVQPRSAMVARSSPDVLVMEAIDLLGYVCTLHPAWQTLAAEAETLTLEALQERTRVKTHLTGLGAPRRS